MIRVDDLVKQIAALQRSDLEAWVRDEFVGPRQDAENLLFTDIEFARVRLIRTLRYGWEIDADTLPVVLSLIDQRLKLGRAFDPWELDAAVTLGRVEAIS